MIYDIIIIGMGISGITAGMYAKKYNLTCLMLEKSTPGGLLNSLSHIDNYPGLDENNGPDLAMKLFQQVNDLKLDYKIEEVIEVVKEKDVFKVNTSRNSYQALNVILATGRTPIELGLNNEKELFGRGISHCALCDGDLYRNKNVAVVGMGKQAIEEALYLVDKVDKLYMISKIKLNNNKFAEKLLNYENVELIENNEVTSYIVEDNKLLGLKLNDKEIKVDGVFIYLGYKQDISFLKDMDVANNRGTVMVDEDYFTGIDGLYAIGDAIPKDVYQLVGAANDGFSVIKNIAKTFKVK